MLDCPGCLQRCFRAVVYRSKPLNASRRQSSVFTPSGDQLHRFRPHSTAVEPSQERGFITARQQARRVSKERWYPPQEENARILAHKHRAHGPKDTTFSPDIQPSRSDLGERQLQSELAYLKDPLKLSDRIWNLLHQDDSEKAIALARMASSKLPCVVSWNHIIDWHMSKGKVNTAMKIYNEMKKRAQFPDSHTYLLLLRGFSEHPRLPNSCGNALAIYHSMSATGARVPPAIIHSNAMLKVCARANNTDAMWGVIARLPEEGSGAPDNVTFTTILNSLRTSKYDMEMEETSEEDFAARRDSAVNEGRRLWDTIIQQWRRGNILIDADLVCAMGRLLLDGVRARDWDDILSLVQQTMDIARLVPPFGSEERNDSHVAPRLRAPYMPAGLKKDVRLPNKVSARGEESRPRGEFDSITAPDNTDLPGRSSSPTFAQPDNNTLSLVISACQKMAAKKLADQYWELFTQKFGIVPDLDNLHVYLRCLRQYRSSSHAAELLRTELARTDMAPAAKTFRIAMSCCERDKKNPNVMTNANQLLDLMEKRLSEPDPKTLTLYLELALGTWDKEHQSYAIKRAENAIVNIRSKLNFADKLRPAAKEEALEFLREAQRAYHVMLQDDSLTKSARAQFQERRARLQAFMTRHTSPEEVHSTRGE